MNFALMIILRYIVQRQPYSIVSNYQHYTVFCSMHIQFIHMNVVFSYAQTQVQLPSQLHH